MKKKKKKKKNEKKNNFLGVQKLFKAWNPTYHNIEWETEAQ